MRRSIVRFTTPIGKTAGGLFTAPFSSGAGRGRGHGAGVDHLHSFVKSAPGKPVDDYNNNISGPGHGRGGGEVRVPGARVDDSVLTRPDPSGFGRKVPEFIQRMQEEERVGEVFDDIVVNRRKGEEEDVRYGLVNVLPGTGRGKVVGGGGGIGIGVKQQPDNRFFRARQDNVGSVENVNVNANNAMGILSRGDGSGGDSGGFGGGDRGERVMESGARGGGRGRGRGGRGFRGRGGRGGRFGGRERYQEDNEEDDEDDGCFIGDPADGEKLARKLGPEVMNQLVEGFEEVSDYVLPSVQQDAFIEAMHINYAIECEPEYLFGDFESNPDIDEKPPMTLRECFDKAKPFLMAYENIQSHEEWEEAVEDAMKQVPLMKQIVDYYSGPDRVTAKKQMEELERVAKTLPDSAPASVKRFTNRAVLSLQSNPGWGFDKKCQFMDKLVWEVSQQYK
ncbi:Histone-lysine N-methyltransferase 2B-like [Heracleum sosnowskyi]|uniref:Histone-lysine N-methyltransferase 2B-like n=1 Tax=Heracleum sosnowskyi TaxID=360622 RepID=A0AAD8IW30_9APIA|nr:Histone-lysine N-methyltransferase 2B-like [Heracleum sosnowskyi]